MEGLDLVSGMPIWAPFELTHVDYTLPLPPSLGCYLLSSNGLASGNTKEEAVTHALLELIERDALTLWRLGQRPDDDLQVNPETVDEPVCRALIEQLDAADVAVAIWDITSDVGIPAFFATVNDRVSGSWRALYPASGSGCHTNRSVALARALTEAAQSRLTLISGARDDHSHSYYKSLLEMHTTKNLDTEILQTTPDRDYSSVCNYPLDNFREILELLVVKLRNVGIRHTAIIDLSKPEYPISVVRAITPGLEGPSNAPGYQTGNRAIKHGANSERA